MKDRLLEQERVALMRIFLENAPYFTLAEWADFPREWRVAYELAHDLILPRLRVNCKGEILPAKLFQADILTAMEAIFALGLFLRRAS